MLLIQFDQLEYSAALQLQLKIVQAKIERHSPDVLILLEHPPTISLGARSCEADVLVDRQRLDALGVSVFQSDRGGMATYHGPGQLVAYPILNLRKRRLTVTQYVHMLEDIILSSLAQFNIHGFRRERKIGIWTGPDEKIASIGVRIKNRIAYHGLSINRDLRDNPSDLIVCCGMSEAKMVGISQSAAIAVSDKMLREAVIRSFEKEFKEHLEPADPECLVSFPGCSPGTR
jgi:lipoate-protein ligase B